MGKRKDIPLGKIMHIINNEAITRPNKPFTAEGATVVLPNLKRIGKLGYPFGPVRKPYQPVILNSNIDQNLVGELIIAQIQK